MKKRILFAISVATILSSMSTSAKNTTVLYRCPTINEIDLMDTRTSINDKTVHWEIKSNGNSNVRHDKIIAFMQVILEKIDSDSYDRSVSCVYRSTNNKKFTLAPIASFHWYVDGIAEKAIGKYWTVASNGDLECNNSVKNCVFQFK